MTEHKKGSNELIKVTFTDAAGNEIAYDDIVSLSVDLFQGSVTIASYTKASPEIREGDLATEVEFEVTTTASALLTVGKPLSVRYKITVANADFDVEAEQTDIVVRDYFDLVS